MAKKQIPSIPYLRKILICDAESGSLTWRRRPRSMFVQDGHFNSWNKRCAGKPAINSPNGNGYLCGRIDNNLFLAHRVIWAMHHSEWPEFQIDHINGVRSDNRISNLRSVTQAENSKNVKLMAHNTSGYHGVRFRKDTSKWTAEIQSENVIYRLGNFHTKEEAIMARQAAEKDFGFHPNHGRQS